jgi:predicted enzyme related to lactoylglutathione lyase
VADLDLMRRFYQELLGMTPSRTGSTFVTFNDVLALAKSDDPGLQGPSRVSVHLEVNEIESLWRQVQQHGVRIMEPLAVDAGVRRRFRCLDPEGNVIEVRDVGAEAPTGTDP